MDDEIFYETVAEELERGELRKGLWTKALTEAGGGEAGGRVYRGPTTYHDPSDRVAIQIGSPAARL